MVSATNDLFGAPTPSRTTIVKSALMSPEKPPLYRWWLERAWGDGSAIVWIMLNPSMADHEIDDPTMLAVIWFSQLWGYGRCVVVNQYPIRSPSPAVMVQWLKGSRDLVLGHNLGHIRERCRSAERIMAAWGNGAPNPAWTAEVIDAARGCSTIPGLWCLGRTSSGAPKHPLARGAHRIPRDQRPLLWSAA